MDLQTIIKAILNSRRMRYDEISKALGVSVQAIAGRLNRPTSMTVDTLLKYLDVLDCELEIREKKEKGYVWVITKSNSYDGGE